ncbi:MAG: hypothetical protein Q4B70_16385, partial [Lachnospiraceae bacterium]|nr:hypothetical protein [Lachnospiraceae bacterium]
MPDTKKRKIKLSSVILFSNLCTILILFFCILHLFHFIIQQNIRILGVAYEQFGKDQSILFLNHIFQTQYSSKSYEQGLSLLQHAGYETTYHRLFLTPFLSPTLWTIGFLILILIAFIYLQKRIDQRLKDEAASLSRWVQQESENADVFSSSFFPEDLLTAIAFLKERFFLQKALHEKDTERIMHYMEDIAHQLKTPLAIIRMVSEKTLYKYPELASTEEKCIQQVDKMTSMIRDLIHLGKFDCRIFKMNFQPVD